MFRVVMLFALIALGFSVTGCAKPPQRVTAKELASQPIPARTAQQPKSPTTKLSSTPQTDSKILTASIGNNIIARPHAKTGWSDNYLTISQQEDIKLAPGEVVITFDDGPRPGKTDKILSILAEHDVKATFLMLGRAALQHPGLVRDVAKHGHTIGLHTHDHGDLTKLNLAAALSEIERGRKPLVAALSPINKAPAPFFRFPYLAQTKKLRQAVNNAGLVILDVQIDSKDYYKDGPETVLNRTLARLEKQGKGIILFHDIHWRTVEMLPQFLTELKARGYKTVSLVPDERLQLRSNTLLAQTR